jgi:hypothetical protein
MEPMISMQTPPDLRALRTTFLDKQLAYALSYAYKISCVSSYMPGEVTVRLSFDAAPWRPQRNDEQLKDRISRLSVTDADLKNENLNNARVFHVLGDQRVPGLDQLGHEVPVGFHVRGLDESVALRQIIDEEAEISAGFIAGRMVLVSPHDKIDGEQLRIPVTYDGTLQLKEPFDTTSSSTGDVSASAFVVPFFETTHPKYHWLTENACLAFGEWKLSKGVVTASFDVYSAQ